MATKEEEILAKRVKFYTQPWSWTCPRPGLMQLIEAEIKREVDDCELKHAIK
jgi:hypothetical protein